MDVPAVSMESSVRCDWLWSNEIFDLPAEAWPLNSTFCSLTAFLDALVTSMYLVGDVQSFKRLKESFHKGALLDSLRYCQYGRKADLRQCFSGHPSLQNSFSFEHISSLSWWSRISCRRRSAVGRQSFTCDTYRFSSVLSCLSSFVRLW